MICPDSRRQILFKFRKKGASFTILVSDSLFHLSWVDFSSAEAAEMYSDYMYKRLG